MAQYFNLPYFPVTGDNFYESMNGWRKNLITDVESTIKPKFTIAQTKSDLKTNSVDYTEQKKSEALSICTEIMDNLKNNFIGFNNFPAFGTFKNNAFEFSSIELDWLVKTGQMTESQKLIELAQLNAKKSIVDNTESYWSNSLDDYKIGGVKWNEARDLFISAHETEAEGTTAFKALIKDSVFELYSNMRDVEIVDKFGDYISLTGEKNTAILAKDELLATKVSARTELGSQMDTLNVEKEDPSTTPERVTEIDVTLADLQSQIDVILAEETAISEEWDLIDAVYNKRFEWMNLRGSAARSIANQLEDFIMNVYGYFESNIGQYKLGNKETASLLNIKFGQFNLISSTSEWGYIFPQFINTNSNRTYFGDLMDLFDSREVAVNSYNTYKETLVDIYSFSMDFFDMMLYTKKTALTKDLYLIKVTQFTDAVVAKQAQIDVETDETLLATYQEELTRLNGVLNNFTTSWEVTAADNMQTTFLSAYDNIKTQIDDLSTQIFNIDLQISYLINKISLGFNKIVNGTREVDQYAVANWSRVTDYGSHFGRPLYMNYIDNPTGMYNVNDPTSY